MIGFVHRLKQVVQQTAEGDHGPSGIHQQQQLYRVFPGFFHDDLQAAAVAAGLVHGAVDVQLRLRNVQPAGKLPELTKSHLELSVVQHPIVTEIPIFSGSYHRKCGLVSCLASNPDTAHISSRVAEGCLAHGTDPKTPTVVLAVLILQPLPELFLHIFLVYLKVLHLIQVVPGLLLSQLHHIGLVQPAKHLLANLRIPLGSLKAFVEGHIEFVEIRLAFHQYHPGHIIKLCQGAAAESLVQRLLQGQPLSQRHPQAFLPQGLKKFYEHTMKPAFP